MHLGPFKISQVVCALCELQSIVRLNIDESSIFEKKNAKKNDTDFFWHPVGDHPSIYTMADNAKTAGNLHPFANGQRNKPKKKIQREKAVSFTIIICTCRHNE